jgi:hypothetical protein
MAMQQINKISLIGSRLFRDKTAVGLLNIGLKFVSNENRVIPVVWTPHNEANAED